MCIYIRVYTYVHTLKLATGPTGIGMNLDKSHPLINGQLVTQAGGSRAPAVVHATWPCSVSCGNRTD